MRPKEILILANETVGGEHLRDAVEQALKQGPAYFTLIVPATPPRGTMTWTEAEALSLASWRLSAALDSLGRAGAKIRGWVGDARPLDSVADALRYQRFDEVILSTFPRGRSRWLQQGLPKKISRWFGLPVTHVVAESDESAVPDRALARAG